MKSALDLLRELRRDGNSFNRLAESDAEAGYDDNTPASAHVPNSVAAAIDGCQIRQNRQNLVHQVTVRPAKILRFWSEVLSEEVLVVPDDVPVIDEIAADGRIVYKHSEVHSLFGVTLAGLRLIHEAKRVFGGDVLPDQDTAPKQLALSGMIFPWMKAESELMQSPGVRKPAELAEVLPVAYCFPNLLNDSDRGDTQTHPLAES